MEFSRTKEQQALWSEMYRFASELGRDLVIRDENGDFAEENWQAVAQKGVLGLYLPKAYGGSDYDMVTTINLLEALGYGCPDNGFTLAINGQMWTVQEPIFRFGTEQQKQKYLPRLIDGSLKGAHGMTESESGSDAFSLSTTAKRVDGGYILNGKKFLINLGPNAGIVIVFATTNPDLGRWGVTTFIVEADSPGLVLGAPKRKMGLRTVLTGDIELHDVFVPDDNLLGREGAGASIFNASMEYERSFIFASHVGSMARQLDEAVAFAKQRKQGGKSIGKYQSVSNRIADMKVRLDTSRLMLFRAAWLMDCGKSLPMEAALAKLVISESFIQNSIDVIRIHGGRGYLTEYEVERDLRDAMGGVIYTGTSDIQRNLIAGLLGL